MKLLGRFAEYVSKRTQKMPGGKAGLVCSRPASLRRCKSRESGLECGRFAAARWPSSRHAFVRVTYTDLMRACARSSGYRRQPSPRETRYHQFDCTPRRSRLSDAHDPVLDREPPALGRLMVEITHAEAPASAMCWGWRTSKPSILSGSIALLAGGGDWRQVHLRPAGRRSGPTRRGRAPPGRSRRGSRCSPRSTCRSRARTARPGRRRGCRP